MIGLSIYKISAPSASIFSILWDKETRLVNTHIDIINIQCTKRKWGNHWEGSVCEMERENEWWREHAPVDITISSSAPHCSQTECECVEPFIWHERTHYRWKWQIISQIALFTTLIGLCHRMVILYIYTEWY